MLICWSKLQGINYCEIDSSCLFFNYWENIKYKFEINYLWCLESINLVVEFF